MNEGFMAENQQKNLKEMLFILNPLAGKREGVKKLFDIVWSFSNAGYIVTVYPTKKEEDAENFIVDACLKKNKKFDIIVCSGGDGTLNEVVSGLMTLKKRKKENLDEDDFKEPLLGYIPSGTVNDFASSMEISKDVDEAVRRIIKGETKSFDVGYFNDKYFAYVAGFGAFTNVSYDTPQNLKNIFGNIAYFLESVRQLTSIESHDCVIEYDGNIIQENLMVALVSSSASIAGFQGLSTPETSMDDGFFEITLIRKPETFFELRPLISALLRQDSESENIISLKAKNIAIRCKKPVPWTLDGEYGGTHDVVNIINNYRAIKIIR